MTEGIKVFVGGTLIRRENRYIFESVPEQPLLVIFYDGPDRSLAPRAVSSGRHKNEYWNYVTPYAFILGAFSQILKAVGYIPRPAFRLTAVAAFIAIFIPLFPLIPPGLIFTLGYRRLWWLARIYRAYRDLVRLPWRHIIPGSSQGRLPDGEPYIARYYETLPPEVYSQGIPFIIPPEENGKGLFRPRRQGKSWYIFGVLNPEDNAETALPRAPSDPFAISGILPGKGRSLSRHYNIRGYVYGGIALVLLLSAVALNMFFIVMICFLLLL
jgi:hypothetical protein